MAAARGHCCDQGEGEEFQAGYISYTIGVGQEQMEVVEKQG